MRFLYEESQHKTQGQDAYCCLQRAHSHQHKRERVPLWQARSKVPVPGGTRGLNNTVLLSEHPEQPLNPPLCHTARRHRKKIPTHPQSHTNWNGEGEKKRIIVKEMNCIKPSKRQTSNLGQFGNRILPHSDLFPQTNSAISNCCHVPQSCIFTPSSSCDFLPCLLPMITTYFLTSHCSLELWRILFERNLV